MINIPKIIAICTISAVLGACAGIDTGLPINTSGPMSPKHNVRMTVDTPCGLFNEMKAPVNDRRFQQLLSTDRRCQAWYRLNMRDIQNARRFNLAQRRQAEQERRSAHNRQRNWSRDGRNWIDFLDRLGGSRRSGNSAW